MSSRKVARGDGKDTVKTNHTCQAMTVTESCSTTVFVNGTGIHRKKDTNAWHTILMGIPCVLHQTTITKASDTVFADGEGVARIKDSYGGCGATVDSGSANVFAGGPSLPGSPVPPSF